VNAFFLKYFITISCFCGFRLQTLTEESFSKKNWQKNDSEQVTWVNVLKIIIWNTIVFLWFYNLLFALRSKELKNVASLKFRAFWTCCWKVLVTFFTHEVTWSSQNQTNIILKKFLMVEPVFVAKNSDEFWFGVKV